MAKKKKFVDPDLPYFRFLARLRSGGRSNMYGAIPYLVDDFRISREEAFRIVCRWVDERAAAGEAQRDERPARVALPLPAASRAPRAEQMSIAFDGVATSPSAPTALPDQRRKRAARAIPRVPSARVAAAPAPAPARSPRATKTVAKPAVKRGTKTKTAPAAKAKPVVKHAAKPAAKTVPKAAPKKATKALGKPQAAPKKPGRQPKVPAKPVVAKAVVKPAAKPKAPPPASPPVPAIAPAQGPAPVKLRKAGEPKSDTAKPRAVAA